MARWGLGPVFLYECVTAARRWQTYAGRAAFLAALLVSLVAVWAGQVTVVGSLSRTAQVGESYFLAIAGTQLVLVLLAAPAYTAGAVCLDKARGNLAHMLVTDLSSAEIVLGKIGSRLLPVLGMVLAGLPVLAVATLLGGIDSEAVVGSFLVTLGVAVAGCALALALSVWGRRPHEVIIAAYFIIALLVVPLPAWGMLNSGWGRVGPPSWLEKSNPFWLAFAPQLRPEGAAFDDYLTFLGGCAVMAGALTLLATLTLRRAAVNDTPRCKRGGEQVQRGRPLYIPSLDFNPVLWRELNGRRPAPWMRAAWVGYAVLSVGATLCAVAEGDNYAASFVNAFQFAIGLLLVSVTSVTRLFEERVAGSLDVLLVTPLPTASIVSGKWWATYRTVVLLTVLPTALACWFGRIDGDSEWNTGASLPLLVTLMLAYGAFVTSLGLALATWVRRFGVAVGLSVATYLLLAAGSVLVLGDSPLATISPWYGVGELTYAVSEGHYKPARGVLFFVIYTVAAAVLTWATRESFDRCLGRVEGHYPLGRPPLPAAAQSPAPAGSQAESKADPVEEGG
jgi:ABC-type transport system involved in multi-copper enzyme maturation permease subunit